LRLSLLRALYLLVVVGLGIMVWPGVILRIQHYALFEGVVASMLAAFSALAILGLRYPLQMLPLLLWELAWKSIWLLLVALPLWLTGTLEGSTLRIASDCLLVVVIPFVIPWRHVFAQYVAKPAERWRWARLSPAEAAPEQAATRADDHATL
jgi:hypothetical protein